MAVEVRLDEVGEDDLPPVDYRWDADTDILCATLRPSSASEGLSGSVDIEGPDGAWLMLEVQSGRLAAVEVAVWPEVRTVRALQAPVATGTARLRIPAGDRGAAVAALEVDTPIRAVADEAERTIHFRIGPPGPVRALRVAREILAEVDARSRLTGLWLLNVPPFPQSSAP
jgi:hypothetical protein